MNGNSRGVFEKVPGSGIWWVRYFDAAGRKRREKVGTKGMALQLYRKRKVEAMQGKKLPETLRKPPVTFNQLADAALEWARSHKRTWDDDVTRMKMLREWFGASSAADITPQDIDRRLSRGMEQKGWTPATVNRYKALISMVYRLAVIDGKVTVNPARLVRQRPVDNARVRWLADDEEARLRAAIQSECFEHLPELELALHTGMRMGEQYSLTWDCVDFDRGLLTIQRSKNGRARYIPLNAGATKALLALKAQAKESPWVIVNVDTAKVKSKMKGKPRRSPRNWFEPAVKTAALADFTWHCLRHTFASRLTMAGVDLRSVQELMGHKDIKMTCRYAHLAPDHQLASVARLDGWGQRSKREAAAPSDPRTDTGRKASAIASAKPTAKRLMIQRVS